MERKAVDKLLRAREVAERLGLSQYYVYELVQSGKLSSVKVGERAIRVRESDVERFISERSLSKEG